MKVESEIGLTENESLFDRVSDDQLKEIVRENTVVSCKVDSNSYGRFLFVKVKVEKDGKIGLITFYGLGWHEYRDKYFVDVWHHYTDYNIYDDLNLEPINTEKVLEKIEKRRTEIKERAKGHKQSKNGKLFSELADVADDDGAYSMLYLDSGI